MNSRIYLSRANVTGIEEEYVLRALRSGWIAPLGPDVDAFEQEIASRVGVRHAVALSSGTAALHLALLALGVRPGSTVLVPTLTFAASANAIKYTGAEPVFIDSDPKDGNIDPGLLLEAIDVLHGEGQEISAAMTVDLFGRACDYDRIEAELKSRGIPLLEDAAESLGATFGDRATGSFGNAAALSFNGNKIMTTSGGGMLLSDDSYLIARARKLSTQAREPVPWYEHREVGYNYRMSNLLAALGRAQLSRLDELIDKKRHIHSLYREGLQDVPGVGFLGDARQGRSADNHWLTVLLFAPHLEISIGDVVAFLESKNIEARHVWKPMHLQPLFSRARVFTSGASELLFQQGLTLPCSVDLTDTDIERVCSAIRAYMTSVASP